MELSEEVRRDLLRCVYAAREMTSATGNQGLWDAAERALQWLVIRPGDLLLYVELETELPPICYPIVSEWDYLAANAGSVPDYLVELDDDGDDYDGVRV